MLCCRERSHSTTCAQLYGSWWSGPMSGDMPASMLAGMKTTVSLTDEVRNRLAALAARHGRTMGEEIAAMVERAEYDVFWADVALGYEGAMRVVVHDDYPE